MEHRIAKLERQCRWYRNLFILAGLVLMALVTWGATKPIPDVIKAHSLEVMRNNGEVAIRLSGGDSGWITVYGPGGREGRTLVSIGAVLRGGSVIVQGLKDEGAVRMYGGGDYDTGGFLAVDNKSGDEVVQLFPDKNGNGVVGAYNRKGKGRTLKPGP